jgi:hypothetical protein
MNSGQPIDEVRRAEWQAQFREVEPGILERAFQAVMRVHEFPFIPAVAAVWKKLDELRQADSLAEQQAEHERWLSAQPAWEELRRRGRDYCAQVRAYTQEIADLQKRPRLRVMPEPIVIATPERLAELEEQKRQILARYPRPVESAICEG